MIPCCIDQGLAIIPWSPMARGFFSGNHRQANEGTTTRAKTDDYAREMYYRPEDFTVADRVQEVAKQRGVSGSQIALAWVLNKPYVTAPIIGASRMEHLDQAIAALDIKLSEAETKSLEEPYQVHPVLGHS
jgi:aryl-alcohol dehydrogenase-like predicted oxidoreductase